MKNQVIAILILLCLSDLIGCGKCRQCYKLVEVQNAALMEKEQELESEKSLVLQKNEELEQLKSIQEDVNLRYETTFIDLTERVLNLNKDAQMLKEQRDLCLATTRQESYSIYEVQKGDSLSGIALEKWKSDTLWFILWKENEYIDDPDLIYPGYKLRLPNNITDDQRRDAVIQHRLRYN